MQAWDDYLSQRKSAASVAPINALKKTLIEKQRAEREALHQQQEARWAADAKLRSARLRKGWSGLWDKVTGQSKQTRARNELEALQAQQRDRLQRDQLVWAHIQECAKIDKQRTARRQHGLAKVQRLAALLPEHARQTLQHDPRMSGPAIQ